MSIDFESTPDTYGNDFASDGPTAPRSQAYLHPVAMLFNWLFKAVALAVYLPLSLIFGADGNKFIIVFVITVFFCAADFWTVKNVCGRLLVGLRWWNTIAENGDSVWHFESRQDRSTVHRGEAFGFWLGQGIFTLVWFVFGLKNLIGLSWDWLIVDLICLSLSLANLIGFLKCVNAARKLTSVATDYAVNYAVEEARGRVTSGNAASSQSDNDFN